MMKEWIYWGALSALILAPGCANSTALVADDEDLEAYVVQTRTAEDAELIAADVNALGGTVTYEYRDLLFGFAAEIPVGFAETLREDDRVLVIELDQPAIPMGTQSSPPAQLDRIDSVSQSYDLSYSWTSDGTGVNVYVLDTGIRSTHQDFTGRVGTGYSYFAGGTNDTCGHGTHVSGVAAGTTSGVAKGATVIPVRVINCSTGGTTSSVLGGLNWISANGSTPAVINASFILGSSPTVDSAVASLIAAGYTFVASVDCASTCTNSLARVSGVIGVGPAPNSGCPSCPLSAQSCIDVYAMGNGVVSAWYTSDTAYSSQSGVSYATPQVAGVAARYLDANPTATPAQVASYIDGQTQWLYSCIIAGFKTLYAPSSL